MDSADEPPKTPNLRGEIPPTHYITSITLMERPESEGINYLLDYTASCQRSRETIETFVEENPISNPESASGSPTMRVTIPIEITPRKALKINPRREAVYLSYTGAIFVAPKKFIGDESSRRYIASIDYFDHFETDEPLRATG